FRQRRLVLLMDDVLAQLDALVADEDGRPGNELAHLVLALAAEGAVERVLRIAAADLAHFRSMTRCESWHSLLRGTNQGCIRFFYLRGRATQPGCMHFRDRITSYHNRVFAAWSSHGRHSS